MNEYVQGPLEVFDRGAFLSAGIAVAHIAGTASANAGNGIKAVNVGFFIEILIDHGRP